MSLPDLPLPTPGQSNWAVPLNQSLEALNDALENVPTFQDIEDAVINDLSSILSLSKSVHLEDGQWVWDGPNGPLATHYVLPDHAGDLIVRATPFPTPGSTPVLTW